MKYALLPFLLFVTAGFGFNANLTSDVPSRLLPATVEISVKETKEGSFVHSGTGWLYNGQTTVITADHVVDGFDVTIPAPDGKGDPTTEHKPYDSIRITFSDGKQVVVSGLKETPEYDVAVLTLNSKDVTTHHDFLTLAPVRANIGDRLWGAGFPFKYECLLLTGYVTGYHTVASGAFKGEYLVTNAVFAPGNSGGPIVDDKGDVIGMVDWIDGRSPALSFAVTVDSIRKSIK